MIGTDYIGSCKSNYHTITMTRLSDPFDAIGGLKLDGKEHMLNIM
jgi:hypothetical protein